MCPAYRLCKFFHKLYERMAKALATSRTLIPSIRLKLSRFYFKLGRILPSLSWLSIFWHWTPRQFDFGVRFIGARSQSDNMRLLA